MPKVVAKGQQRLATGCGRAHRANAAVQPRGPTRRSQVLVKCIFQEYAAAYSCRGAAHVCVEKRRLVALAQRARLATLFYRVRDNRAAIKKNIWTTILFIWLNLAPCGKTIGLPRHAGDRTFHRGLGGWFLSDTGLIIGRKAVTKRMTCSRIEKIQCW